MTDASGDDIAEYLAGSRTVRVRAGTGATTAAGGALAVNSTISFRFRVTVDRAASGTTVTNTASLAYRARTIGKDYTFIGNAVSTPIATLADLAVAKTSTPAGQAAGGIVTYSITATNNDQESGSVDFDVYVPRQSTLHVSSGDGALNLEGVKGQITLRSGDGPIEVSNGGGQLQVNTGDGVIRVIKFEGQVDARTGDGEIALDGNFNAVTARTGDGTISLSVPAGSSFTIETNAPDEISNEGFTVAEDVTPSPRVKRWRIGNGGKIFVLKTGEGKILLRPRQ